MVSVSHGHKAEIKSLFPSKNKNYIKFEIVYSIIRTFVLNLKKSRTKFSLNKKKTPNSSMSLQCNVKETHFGLENVYFGFKSVKPFERMSNVISKVSNLA